LHVANLDEQAKGGNSLLEEALKRKKKQLVQQGHVCSYRIIRTQFTMQQKEKTNRGSYSLATFLALVHSSPAISASIPSLNMSTLTYISAACYQQKQKPYTVT
jgi:hypothetical protein